jgi:hypothetical protein
LRIERIIDTILLTLIALVVLVWVLIQTTPVQNLLVNQVTRKLSKDLKTTVSIKHVDFAFFNKMLLEGTLVKDQHQDTLLYAGTAAIRITDWFFFKDKVELEYVGLKNAAIHLQRTDSTWNYQFLIDYFSTPKKGGSKNSIELNLKHVELENIAVIQKDAWRGENLTASLKGLLVDAKEINLSKHVIKINSIHMQDPSFAIYNYLGNRTAPADMVTREPAPVITNDPERLRWNVDRWDLSINELTINNGSFKHDLETNRAPYASFDGQHIFFSAINGNFKEVQFKEDSLTATVALTAKERSGFEIKKMNARLQFHPEGMEFYDLDLRTNRSHLHNFFALRYNSFAEMNEFISKVRMEGHFDNAVLNSDDIAYFAPAVKSWKKKINLSGVIRGTVENINAKDIIIEAGRNTYLNGNISLAGLPDINKTYIDFEANDFRTIYADAVAFIPQLRNITQPRLDLLQFLRFRGNFTGFVTDFVTYGSLETKLGTLVTDVNMKLPVGKVASYSGSVKTNGFHLGLFLDNSQLGRAAFEGKVNGSGLNAGSLNAKLDGVVHLLEFNDYPFQKISVKGNVAKRLFNGELIAADPNLHATLVGLIDFSKSIPLFNLDATVSIANLKNLKFVTDSINFNGKFHFNFQGNNIDNFLGTARIFDASILRRGQRISFDSLYLESKMVDNNKIITAISNEFDAALAGEFSIKDLPAAFQAFLNKYYPAYIKPSSVTLKNENFSFVITTKKVDEYIGLIHKDLSGFNFSTITGRINSKENLLDLNAEVPQFGYKNITFHNLNLKGTGTLDSLLAETRIADVYINDSLHFPGTYIKVRSSNDISDVAITTSANQTLNAANILVQVQTLARGVKIKFRESSFEVNGKTWLIDKDGELILSESLVSADGIKLYNGQQEVLVTTIPSDIGNTNDIKVELKKVNIGDFTPYILKNMRLEGLLTGNVSVLDPFGRFSVEVNGEAEHFRFENDSVGKVKLNANFTQRSRQVNYHAISENPNYNFDVTGNYKLGDSVTRDQIDMTAVLNPTKIEPIKKYLKSVFSEMSGLASGNLRVVGPINDLRYLGKLQLNEGRLKVTYTNVTYKIPAAIFDFKEDRIDFGSFTIEDTFQNKGYITRGILRHKGFDNLDFDFAMTTNKLLVLATNNEGNDPFYGNVVARANMTFQGPLADMQMDIEAEPADSSSLYIDSRSGRENNQADFVVWKVYGREMETYALDNESNLTVNLDVTANNYANMYVIIDDLTGDIIKANGRGNLRMRATTSGEFSLTGRYDIDRGNYDFTFQTFLSKPFTLREGTGNYIQWTGDPNKATIKIDAEYRAENVRFSDLDLTSLSGGTDINDNVRQYRGEILVLANLTGDLMSPTIRFQIELPQNSTLKNDLDGMRVLSQIQNDENELNKQVAFLIVFNRFGPLSTSANQGLGNIAFEGIVVNSISGVLSNTLNKQFSNMFQKIFNDKSIQVNFNAQFYSGTNMIANINQGTFNIDRTNLNLSVAKSVFNERLTFTLGSAVDFGLTSQQVNASGRTLPFLPDLTAEWKLTPEGRLLLTFFYRDSYNYLAGAGVRQNRSGASISYRKEFDRLSDLWRGGKKKDKKTLPAATSTDRTGTH